MDIKELKRKKTERRIYKLIWEKDTLSPNDSNTKQNLLVAFVIISFSNNKIDDTICKQKKGDL